MKPKHIDQSHFSEFQDMIQPPPEAASRMTSPQIQVKTKKPILIIGIVLMIIFLMMAILLYLSQISQPAQLVETPTPTPTKKPLSSEMQQTLLKLNSLIEQANPNQQELSLPVVNMDVAL